MVNSITLLYDRIRWEEKALAKAIEAKGIDLKRIDSKTIILESDKSNEDVIKEFGDLALQRCVSYFRGLHLTSYLESKGFTVVNHADVSRICGNKFLTTLALDRCDVPTPRTEFALSSDAAKICVEKIGYPSVLKPVVGSWGRGVAKLNDRDSAYALIEMREGINEMMGNIYYIQSYIETPSRDIRTIVVGDDVICANYRYAPSSEWRTNVSRGGTIESCKITNELEDIVCKAANAVGGGILGVDVMEGPDGLVVHEINSTVEFKGASQVSNDDISGRMVDYITSILKR